MTEQWPTMKELLDRLLAEGRMSREDMEKITAYLEKPEPAPEIPVYLHVLSCAGAWLSSIFFISFLVVSELLDPDSVLSAMLCGALFLAGAVGLSKVVRAPFLSHLSLALAITGHFLVVMGWTNHYQTFPAMVLAHAALCAVMYPIYSHSVYRFLAPLVLAILVPICIIVEDQLSLLPVLVAAEALLAGYLLLSRRRPSFLEPLTYSAAAMLPVTVLSVHLPQEGGGGGGFGQALWPSSLFLAAGLIYLFIRMAGGMAHLREPWLILAVLSTLLLGIFAAPGILVAAGLLVLGHAFSDNILTGLSYVFLPCFLVLFYCTMEIDLMHKSWIIGGSGLVLLVVRSIAGRCKPGEVKP